MSDTIAQLIETAASQMHRAGSVDDTLEVIVRSAAVSLPHFDHVGVSTPEKKGTFVTRAVTSDLARELDDVQYTLREGPCVDSLTGTDVTTAPRIEHDARWPTYVPRALPHGLRSQLAVRLFRDDRGTLGGLNLYSTTSEEIAAEDVVLAAYFAAHASMALSNAQERATLTAAVATRQAVGQAIGIVMERYKIDEKAAHAYLWRASSHTNRKVRDVAAELVSEANRPGVDPPR